MRPGSSVLVTTGSRQTLLTPQASQLRRGGPATAACEEDAALVRGGRVSSGKCRALESCQVAIASNRRLYSPWTWTPQLIYPSYISIRCLCVVVQRHHAPPFFGRIRVPLHQLSKEVGSSGHKPIPAERMLKSRDVRWFDPLRHLEKAPFVSDMFQGFMSTLYSPSAYPFCSCAILHVC